uniref:Uncharacterized protein n=1 Tax=Rhizophora mucronata TaxID=61149 RepID=A0A2P2P5R4_RHIMU
MLHTYHQKNRSIHVFQLPAVVFLNPINDSNIKHNIQM